MPRKVRQDLTEPAPPITDILVFGGPGWNAAWRVYEALDRTLKQHPSIRKVWVPYETEGVPLQATLWAQTHQLPVSVLPRTSVRDLGIRNAVGFPGRDSRAMMLRLELGGVHIWWPHGGAHQPEPRPLKPPTIRQGPRGSSTRRR